jgi:hypothetical protein
MENKMSEEIKKFISSYQDISEMKSQIWDIKKSVEKFEKNVVDRIKEIRRIRAKVYNNAVRGRVVDVVSIGQDDISFEVSYCGCCEDDEEDLDVALLLMKDEDVTNFFTNKKKESDAEKLRIKKETEAANKAALEAHEKKEYNRLRNKFAKGGLDE